MPIVRGSVCKYEQMTERETAEPSIALAPWPLPGAPPAGARPEHRQAEGRVLQPVLRVLAEVKKQGSRRDEGHRGAAAHDGKYRQASAPRSSSMKLGGGDPATWASQSVVQSNEGFPDKSRLVEPQGQRVRGAASLRARAATDGNCDPHVMDILAGKGAGNVARSPGPVRHARPRVRPGRRVGRAGHAVGHSQVTRSGGLKGGSR